MSKTMQEILDPKLIPILMERTNTRWVKSDSILLNHLFRNSVQYSVGGRRFNFVSRMDGHDKSYIKVS